MKEYKLVLFDIGGVIVRWHDDWLYEKVAETFQIPLPILRDECEKQIRYLHTGKLTESDFWQMIGKKLNFSKLANTEKSLIYDIFKEKAKINDEALAILKKIKNQKIQVGYLSNLEKTTSSILNEWHIFDNIEFSFLSHNIGSAKPDPQIYKHVIQNIPFTKDQVLFIDDKPTNIEAANSFGINGVVYVSNEKLVNDLHRLRIM